MPSFGAVKSLQKRTGASKADCKAALEEHNDDDEAAAAALVAAGKTSTDTAPVATSSENAQAIKEWSENEQASSVSVLRSEAGDGVTFPAVGDTLSMHYRGRLQSDGTEFDSSYSRNKEFTFKVGVGAVIKGWDVGVMQMSLGEKAILMISSDYGYGANGNGPIPPNADLSFEVHLLRIERGTQRGDSQQVAEQTLGQAGTSSS